MSGTFFISTRNLALHSGSFGGVPGNTALFDLELRGEADVTVLAAAAENLWKDHPLPFPQLIWFRRAVKEEGTPDVATWVAALSVAFQWIVGDPVGFGRVLEVRNGLFTIAVPWERREVLEGAVRQATRFLSLWLRRPAPSAQECTFAMEELELWKKRLAPGPYLSAPMRLLLAARARRVPVEVLGSDELALGWGAGRRHLRGVLRGGTASNTGDVRVWRPLLRDAGFEVPELITCPNTADALALLRDRGEACQLAGGGGAYFDWSKPAVKDQEQLKAALGKADPAAPVVLSRIPNGFVHHLLLVDGRLLLATRMTLSKTKEGPQAYWVDVTADMPLQNRRCFERVARALRLEVCVLVAHIPDLGAVADASAGDNFVFSDVFPLQRLPSYLFLLPSLDVAWAIVSELLAGRSPRPPHTVVSASFGSTTTSRMLVSIWAAAGKVAGLANAEGFWVAGQRVSKTRLASHTRVRALQRQCDVEALVVDAPENGFLEEGNPCDRWDVVCLMNILAGPVLTKDRRQVARVASLRATLIDDAGAAVVLNAEEPACLALLPRVPCRRRILVAPSDPETAALKPHLQAGGEALVIETHDGRPHVMLLQGRSRSVLLPVEAIPAAAGGILSSVVTQALFAAALAVAHELPAEAIRRGLETFVPESS